MINVKAIKSVIKSAMRDYKDTVKIERFVKNELKILGDGYVWRPESLTFYNKSTGQIIFLDSDRLSRTK